jgi:hypothetical protein
MSPTQLRKSIRENPYLTAETRAELLGALCGVKSSYSPTAYEYRAFNRTRGSARAVDYALAAASPASEVLLENLHAELVERDWRERRGEAGNLVESPAGEAVFLTVQPL